MTKSKVKKFLNICPICDWMFGKHDKILHSHYPAPQEKYNAVTPSVGAEILEQKYKKGEDPFIPQEENKSVN